MDNQETALHLRALWESLSSAPPEQRTEALRKEIMALLSAVPKSEQSALLDALESIFPLWPPDVPPPPPPGDDEIVDRLRMRMDVSNENRRRIEKLLRQRELSSGLTTEQVKQIKMHFEMDLVGDPVAGRAVEALVVMMQSLMDMDRVVRQFLFEHDLSHLGMPAPRFKKTVLHLLTLPDNSDERQSDIRKLKASCEFLKTVVIMLGQWPGTYVARLTELLAPNRIERSVPAKKWGSSVHELWWNEYVRRLNGKKDEDACKAEFLAMFKEILNETGTLL